VLGGLSRSVLLAAIGLVSAGSAVATNAPGPGEPSAAARNSFLSRAGKTITANGTAIRMLGYNISWSGPTCAGATSAALEATFPSIVANSRANIVRTGMFETYVSGSLSFATFDNYVAKAKQYGLRIVPTLTDNWGRCGDGRTQKYLSWWQTGYTKPQSSSQPLSYRTYVERFAQHYANEPTIAWYQLANEPDARSPNGSCDEKAAASALRNFADAATTVIKRVDPNHMVDLGAISWCGGQNSDFEFVNAGKVDLCDAYHDFSGATVALPPPVQARVSQCRSSGKPSYLGEGGVCAYVDSKGGCVAPTTVTTLQNRAADFKAKVAAALKAGASGYLIWSLSKGCSGTNSTNQWNIGANNGTPSYGCAVREIDPTETALAGFASP
jgi:hypothetical protein